MSMVVPLQLIGIPRDGALPEGMAANDLLQSVVEGMVGLYDRVGFEPPWIGYLAVKDAAPVGTCAFKSPPVAGEVEIAYFTFPDHEGQGIATEMARELVRFSRQTNPALAITAQTLPAESASTSILKKLGFQLLGPCEHPEDGTVWAWKLT